MKVSVRVGGQSMDVHCGQGGQSIRWLALVASQRLQIGQPNGRQRMREASDARRGFMLPHAVLLRDRGSLEDPEAAINEVMSDGAEVEVVLMDQVEVDEVGAPVAGEWHIKAFGAGEATKRRVNGARLRKELEDKLNSEDHVAITLGGPDGVPGYGRRDASGGFDVTVEGVAISGPLETAGEIRAAMEHDWRSADIGGMVNEPKDALAAKGLLQAHLPTLNQVHVSRSGGRPSGGSAAAMSFNDFAHVLHRYGVLSSAARSSEGHDDGPTAIRRVFDSANRGSWPGDGKTLSRAHFLAALVLIARTREGGLLQALRELLEEQLLPSHAEATSDDVGLEINKPAVQRYVSNNRRLLHSVYLFYAEPSEDGALISLDFFRQLMDDCGVMSAMTATDSGKNKFDFLAETCFLQAQGKPPLQSLVFTECIEAACRLAIMSVEDSSSQGPTASIDSSDPQRTQSKELDAIDLVLDSIIDLGLGDRGLTRK